MLLCVYALNRNPDRDAFFNFVSSQIDPSSATLVCGDFNPVFDRSMDRRGSNPLDSSRESSSALLSLFRDCGMIDIWRSLHPTTVAFSWLRPDGTLSSRIFLLGVRMHGYTLYSLVTCWPAPFLTTVLFFRLFPFQNRLLVARVAGSLISQSSGMPVLDHLSRISGRGGRLGSSLLIPCNFGGTQVKITLKAWLLDFVTLNQKSGIRLAPYCYLWLNTLRLRLTWDVFPFLMSTNLLCQKLCHWTGWRLKVLVLGLALAGRRKVRPPPVIFSG